MTANQAPGLKFLRVALVLVPAVIFIAYYVAGQHRPARLAPVQPPALTVPAGATVSLGGYSFQAGKAPLFTRTLQEPGNTILAGPNQVFVIIPVLIRRDNQPARPAGLTWQLVDDGGAAHPPLAPKNLLVPPAVTLAPALEPVYLLFNLPDGSRQPFLLLTSPAGQAAWRLQRPA